MSFLCVSLVQTQKPLGRSQFESGDLRLKKLDKGQIGNDVNRNKHPRQMVLKKIFESRTAIEIASLDKNNFFIRHNHVHE